MLERGSPGEAPIDRYVVLEYLAEGGMGAIYLGKKMGAGGFEKQVVLKQLLPEFTRQPEFIDLFLREARLSATLDHANIIHTIDLVTAGQDYFIVMEYLDGADLRTLLRRAKKRRKQFSAAAGIYVARELLSALAYAHNKVGPDGTPLRLIHRDISPSNILISGSGEVKLTDFGIAKASTHNSVFYRVKGKVGYMSPEQAQSEHLDARSDLYSLAVCLYEMITGERLFVNVGLTTSAEEMYSQPVPLLSHKVRGLPPELDKVMLKALSRDPDHRYQTAGEFQEALLRCAHRHGLMMSAPELAEHLRAVCGDPDSWRDDGAEAAAAGGTELYDIDEGTEQIEADELLGDNDSDLSVVIDGVEQLVREGPRRQKRARTSLTKLTELKGIELTSMINMTGVDDAGARPLIDFDDLAQQPHLSSAPPGPAPQRALGPTVPLGAILEPPSGVGAPEGFPLPPRTRPPPDPIDETGIVVEPAARARGRAFAPPTETGVLETPTGVPTEPRPGPARPPAALAPARHPLLLLVLILLVGIGTAALIGLSGPTVEASSDLPMPAGQAAPAPGAEGASGAAPGATTERPR
ncbi:MAG TPA: serine/threonine-protein kinase [Kofleriaceae bacterium]|nr:serine/threonine-protein kinase [Kofleriaceae bacterium]